MAVLFTDILFVMLILFSDTVWKFMLFHLKSVSNMYNFQNAEHQDIRNNNFGSCFVWVRKMVCVFEGTSIRVCLKAKCSGKCLVIRRKN
jgi:hypothetical protein